MSSARRIAPILTSAMAALAATLATGCGNTAPATAPPTTTPPAAATTTEAAPTSSPAVSAAPVAGRIIRVGYAGGQVTGDTGKIAVAIGTTVALVVTSDVADEVHLHGYDKSVDVPAGGTATLTVTADIPGGFEVELEKLGQQLLQLQVS